MGFAEVKEKADTIQKAVEESSILVGKTGAGTVQGVTVPVGLDGMETYSKSMRTVSDSLKKSIFKVLFMGTFKNGKSTTLNALLGVELLPVGATEKTAVIAQVIHGANDGLVRIFKNGSPVPEETSFKTFQDQYQLTRQDKRLVEREGGSIDDRFASIDYVLINNSSELLKNGVQLIDSPGLAATKSRAKVTQKFFYQANATVFLLSANHPFSGEEKAFIFNHWVNVEPKPRNVFFLVNFINMKTEAEREDIKDEARLYLEEVFSTNDVFDSELYNKRVFFVNSKGMYEEKNSGGFSDDFGVAEFRRFEKELEAFLVSDERALAPYRTATANLAAVYFEAQKQIEQRRQLMDKPLAELEKNHQASEKKLDELKKDIERMEETIDATQALVSEKILADLQRFITTDILTSWKRHSRKFDENIGILDMIKLALPFFSDREKQAIFRPMISFVQEFVEQQLIEWSEKSSILAREDLEAMRNKLDLQSMEFGLKLDIAHKTFVYGADEDDIPLETDRANKFQLLLSLIQGDISVAVENASGGNFSWKEFFKKYIFQAVINTVIVILVGGGPLGLAALLTVEAVQLRVTGNERSREVLNRLAERVFPKVAESINKKRDDIVASIAEQFTEIKNNVTQAAYDLIEDERNAQKKIIADRDKTKAANDEELARQEIISGELRKRAALVYDALYNREPTDDELKKLSASVTISQKESA